MSLITDELRAFIGVTTEAIPACDPVEQGAVRRFAQAVMDDDPAYAGPGDAGRTDSNAARYGGPVAPPLFPAAMFRRPFGAPDLLQARAADPDFDGLAGGPRDGLPDLPLPGYAILNGGNEVELYRFARHGEQVLQRSRYADIQERESKSGPMLLVIIETDYVTATGEPLLKARKTIIRRKSAP